MPRSITDTHWLWLRKYENMIFTSVEENKQKTLPSLSQKMVPKEQHFQRTQYNSGGEKKKWGWEGVDGCKKSTKCFKGAESRNSAKLGNYKMPVKLRET